MTVRDVPHLILASSSPNRKELLGRLGLPFQVIAPHVEERRLPGESAEHMARRLARSKAQAVAKTFPQALIIGSDQVAVIGERFLGKPGDYDSAVSQIMLASGRTMTFFTAVCLLNAATACHQLTVVPSSVVFRGLDRHAIEHYVMREKPYHCAGAFKSEGLGIVLTERIETDDPTALIGLPLIGLSRMLEQEGVKTI